MKDLIRNSIYRQTLITDLIADYLGFKQWQDTENYFDPESYDVCVERDEDGMWRAEDSYMIYTPSELISHYQEVIN